MVSKVRNFESTNVVGMLPGADLKLKSEAVMYTAHYDHLGIRPDLPGDNIFNGADDNATGCGILLELARVYSAAAQKPRRSIIFASVTAEEQGLLGSEYLGKHPPIPAGKIALDLNYDDVKPLGAPEEVEVSGAERTSFYPIVVATAKEFRLAIRPDARPEAGHYYRSDHFSLARVGIPSFSINEGMKFKGHNEAWGLAQDREYTEKHYHQPSDEYYPGMDFVADAAMARFGFALGWEAASQPKPVGWQPGDEFEATRVKSQ
jgi:Zn-dependent M28 family amino/carboxypeptidase